MKISLTETVFCENNVSITSRFFPKIKRWFHGNFCQILVRVIFHNFHTVLTEKALSKCSSKQSVIHKSHDGIGNSQSQFLDFLAKKVIWYKYGTAKEVEMGSRMFFKVTTKFLISFLRFFFILCSIFFKSELINCSIQLFRHIKFEYRAVNQIKTQKCNFARVLLSFFKNNTFSLCSVFS